MFKTVSFCAVAVAIASVPAFASGHGGGSARSGGGSFHSSGGGSFHSSPSMPSHSSAPSSFRSSPSMPSRSSAPSSYRSSPSMPSRSSAPSSYRSSPSMPSRSSAPSSYRSPTSVPPHSSSPGSFRSSPTVPERSSAPSFPNSSARSSSPTRSYPTQHPATRTTNPSFPNHGAYPNHNPGSTFGSTSNAQRYGNHVVTRGNTTYNYNYQVRNNIVVMQRTHSYGGVNVVRHYNGYTYNHRQYFGYVPYHRYDGWYYGFAAGSIWHQHPSLRYRWSWVGNPWCNYYGYYFQPYPTYYGPSYWLTDYVLAEMLAEEYAVAAANSRIAQANANARQQAMDEETRTQLRYQIEADLRAQQQNQPVQLTNTLSDLRHIYVVSQGMTVTRSDSNSVCSLSGTDTLRLTAKPAAGEQVVSMVVVTSKDGSCQAGTPITMAIATLQTFENDFNEKLENGLQEMKTKLPGELPSEPSDQIQE